MSSNFHSVLVEDNIISQITDEVTFAVQSSGQENYQQFAATSVSTSNITFNAQIPSQEVVLDRNMLLSSNVNFTIAVSGAAFEALATDGTGGFFNYGSTEAFGSYPLNSLITTLSGTINNVSVNSQTQDTLATLLRLNDASLISETNTSTAALPDFYYASYSDGVVPLDAPLGGGTSSSNNPLGNVLQSSFDAVYFGRGTLPAKFAIQQFNAAGAALAGSNTHNRVADAVRAVIECEVLLVEPLMTLSPFVNNASGTSAGLYGINQISLNINLDSNCRRMFRTANVLGAAAPAGSAQGFYTPTFIRSVTLGTAGVTAGLGSAGIRANNSGFSNCQLLARFLTLQPSQVLKLKSSRNSVSYTETPRYLTLQGSQSQVTSRFATGADPHAPSTTQVITSNLQLSLIPDKIVVCARIPMSQQSYGNSDSFYTIQSATILFNSASGLISSATLTDIYKLSRRNGSSQNFFEWSGMASRNGDLGNKMVGTIGSILVIDPAKDLSLPEFLSNSSSGSFNLQIQLNIVCNYGHSPNNSTYPVEIMTTTVNSGIFTCQAGVCSSEVGVLNKEVVLNTKMNTAPESIMMQSEYERLVGGRRHQMSRFNNPALMSHKRTNSMYQPKAHMMGGGVSGGVMSGGVQSGGRLSRHIR